MSWYSFSNGKYYTDTFPFPLKNYKKTPDQRRLDYSVDYKAIRTIAALIPAMVPQAIDDMHLQVDANGDLHLAARGSTHYRPYIKVITEKRSQEEFSDHYQKYLEQRAPESDDR
jgi:hypothetical protein